MLKRILVPTDFSASARAALGYACELALITGAELLLVHARGGRESFPPPGAPRDTSTSAERERRAVSMLAEVVARAEARGVRVHAELDEGAPEHAILERTTHEHIDMVVMGTHGKRAFFRAWAGGVAEHVMRAATVPVMVVQAPSLEPAKGRALAPGVDGGAIGSLLIATDLGASSSAAVRTGFELAEQLGARVHILHVYGADAEPELDGSPTSSRESARQHAAQSVHKLAKQFGGAATLEGCLVRSGDPADVIVRQAEAHRADLVVVGTHARRGAKRVLMGSVASEVVRRAQQPVLIVKPQSSSLDAKVG